MPVHKQMVLLLVAVNAMILLVLSLLGLLVLHLSMRLEFASCVLTTVRDVNTLWRDLSATTPSLPWHVWTATTDTPQTQRTVNAPNVPIIVHLAFALNSVVSSHVAMHVNPAIHCKNVPMEKEENAYDLHHTMCSIHFIHHHTMLTWGFMGKRIYYHG